MKPYYQDAAVTIFHGDARDVLRDAPDCWHLEAIITDPVWPNAHPDLEGSQDPEALLAETLTIAPKAERLLVWLGCQSDPRFLRAVPRGWGFLRQCYLSRAVPSYNGRCLVTGDSLYAYGSWPPSRPGARVIPGECRVTSRAELRQDHPCARNLLHARWVIGWWTTNDAIVLDPFMGVGTIPLASKDLGRKAIGIEIEERYCEIAARRMQQEVIDL